MLDQSRDWSCCKTEQTVHKMRPSLLFLFALVSLSWCQAGTTLTSTFNPNSANGLSGTIVVTQPGLFPTTVTIQSRLNFTAFNWAAVRMAFPMCMDIQHLAWHVHVTWTNGQPQSGFLDACSNASTNGHYDSKYSCPFQSSNFSDLPVDQTPSTPQILDVQEKPHNTTAPKHHSLKTDPIARMATFLDVMVLLSLLVAL
jgi:hypothetical protein